VRTKAYNDPDAALLRGYRFVVCTTAAEAADALEIRRRVYVEGNGYPVAVPDAYDARSWLALARNEATGEPVGSVRITPRRAPLEAEESFTLPLHLRTPRAAEISRLAILPSHRKGRTFVPVVSLGLFKLLLRFAETICAERLVVCSRAERLWTFEWMGFERTGLGAPYLPLAGVRHELLWGDFTRRAEILATHPFRRFFLDVEYDEVRVPAVVPPLGVPGQVVASTGS